MPLQGVREHGHFSEEPFDQLKESDQDWAFGILNKTLMKMKMEAQGEVYVSALAKGKRRVELVK